MTLREEVRAAKRKKALVVLRKLKRRYPEIKKWRLKKMVAEELEVTERTIYNYLDKDR